MDIGKPWKILRDGGKVQHAATWFDVTQNHFVALLEPQDEVSSTGSSKSGSVKSRNRETEEFVFRIYSIPNEKPEKPFFHSSLPLSISLPRSLAIETAGADAPSTRIPFLVKFSLDGALIVLQMTETAIRIIPVGANNNKSQHVKHWSIDMASGDPNPIDTAPDNAPKLHYAYKSIDDKILTGGIIWSDHGGSSQDLVVITNRGVYCYKVSLLRNQMSMTHSFSHPDASAFWWDPISRALVVGSYGPTRKSMESPGEQDGTVLYLRTFFLNFAPREAHVKSSGGLAGNLGLSIPRFELPPPDHLPVFAVGSSRITNIKDDVAMPQQVETSEISLVNLYGKPYIVEADLSIEDAKLELILYQLDRSTREMISFVSETSLGADLELSLDNLSEMHVSVLDNVLCITLPDHERHVFVDVSDRNGAACFSIGMSDQETRIFRSGNIAFIAPSMLLDPDGSGLIYRLELNLNRVSAAFPESRKTDSGRLLSFLLRRQSQSAPSMALAKFSDVISLTSPFERQHWIEQVASVYAREQESCASDRSVLESLLLQCSLLPPGAELRYHAFDMELRRRPSHIRSLKKTVLCQKEILETILIPAARDGIAREDKVLLGRVLRVAVAFAGALHHRQCQPHLALDCLIVALLWRLGYRKEVVVMLNSYNYRSKPSDLARNSREVEFFATLVAATAQEVRTFPFGANDEILDAAKSLLATTMTNPCALVRHLLKRNQLIEAMSISTKLATDVAEDAAERERKSLLLLQSRKEFRGEDFFRVAFECARGYKDPGDRCRLLQSLCSFLRIWDAECLRLKARIQSASDHRQILEMDTDTALAPAMDRMKRRPSWTVMRVLRTKTLYARSSITILSVKRQSKIAQLFPRAIDRILVGDIEDDATLLRLRNMFGYGIDSFKN